MTGWACVGAGRGAGGRRGRGTRARLITALRAVCCRFVFRWDERFMQRRGKLKMRPNMFNIDCELLISAVKERKPIWSSGHPQHLNRKILRNLWNEIGTIFKDVEVPILKRKWKNLKDHFRKEAKKSRTRSGDDADVNEDCESQWPYYQVMKFCLDEFVQMDDVSNHFDDFHDRTQDIDDNASFDDPLSTETSSRGELWGKRKRTLDEHSLEIENRKLKQLLYENDKKEKCDDYYFFQTLIPLMKKFKDTQKLRVRNRINQVVLDEIENVEANKDNKYRTTNELTQHT